MIEVLSKKIAKSLIQNGTDHYSEEVLAYGAECSLNLILSNAILLFIGLLTHHTIDLIIWSLSFVLLRKDLGGIHASSHFACISIGSFVGASSIIISPLLLYNKGITLLILFFCFIISVVIAPVPHINKLYLLANKPVIQRKVAVILLLELTIAGIFYLWFPLHVPYILSGIIYATFFAILGYWFNPR